MRDLLLPLASGVLLVIGCFCAVACYSLRGFSRSRLEEVCRRHGREDRFGVILKEHERALLAVELLLGIVAGLLVAAWVAWWSPLEPAPTDALSGVVLAAELVLGLLLLTLVLVVLPWSLARVGGEAFLAAAWPALMTIRVMAKPLTAPARTVDKFVHRLSGVPEPRPTDAATLSEEIRTVVDEGQREGLLETQATRMIHRVIELQEEDVAAIMTPRTEMHSLPADLSLDEARRRLLDFGHSRVPVIGESTDDILGILYAKDLLRHLDNGNGQNALLRDMVREPLYVPETTGIDTLLERMKREHVHLAIVIDEYSGVSGLVTLEDILEEIVGEIADEFDTEEDDGIQPLDPGVVEVDSWVHIDDLNERFEWDLPEDGDYDTIGGFVLSELGRVPRSRETLTWGRLRITVLKAGKRKIHRLRIEVDESLAAATAEAG